MDEPDDDLAQRISHLEGVVETEDKSVERGLENVKHGQMLLIAVVAVVVGGAFALLVYLLNRLDTLEAMIAHH